MIKSMGSNKETLTKKIGALCVAAACSPFIKQSFKHKSFKHKSFKHKKGNVGQNHGWVKSIKVCVMG